MCGSPVVHATMRAPPKDVKKIIYIYFQDAEMGIHIAFICEHIAKVLA